MHSKLFYYFSSFQHIRLSTLIIFFLFLSLSFSNVVSFSGQITQWNLLFYGTNEPPQRNDPPRYLSNNKKTVNELIHNSLENSQWGFITQDVSYFYYRSLSSHIDVRWKNEFCGIMVLCSKWSRVKSDIRDKESLRKNLLDVLLRKNFSKRDWKNFISGQRRGHLHFFKEILMKNKL